MPTVPLENGPQISAPSPTSQELAKVTSGMFMLSTRGVSELLKLPRHIRTAGAAGRAAAETAINIISDRQYNVERRRHLAQYAGEQSYRRLVVVGSFEDESEQDHETKADTIVEHLQSDYVIRPDMLVGVWPMISQSRKPSPERFNQVLKTGLALEKAIDHLHPHTPVRTEPMRPSRWPLDSDDVLHRTASELEIDAENAGLSKAPLGMIVVTDPHGAPTLLGIKKPHLEDGGVVSLSSVRRNNLAWQPVLPSLHDTVRPDLAQVAMEFEDNVPRQRITGRDSERLQPTSPVQSGQTDPVEVS
jgi:hypothetical protein